MALALRLSACSASVAPISIIFPERRPGHDVVPNPIEVWKGWAKLLIGLIYILAPVEETVRAFNYVIEKGWVSLFIHSRRNGHPYP